MEINREVLKSSMRIRRKRVFRFFSYCALALASVFALTNYLSHLDGLYIKKIYISGNQVVESGRILSTVANVINDRYYRMYPKNNILIYPKKSVEEKILRDIPGVAATAVSSGGDSLLVSIKERAPEYLWCSDVAKRALERTCFYADQTGFSFDAAPKFSGHVYMEFYGGDKRGGYVGKNILPSDEFLAVVNVKKAIEGMLSGSGRKLGIIYGLHIEKNGDYNLLVSDGKEEWKIIFDLNTDAVKKMKAVLASPFFIKELDRVGSRLEYIDLRFSKKVFYKFSR